MRILLINNFHYLRGGAERAYFDLAEILQKKGHQVAFFSTNHPQSIKNDYEKYFINYFELGDPKKVSFFSKIYRSFRLFYKWETRRKLRSLIEDFKPEMAHLHNIFYHLTPAVISELHRRNIPMVMTLHDFRAVSANHILTTAKGEIWEKDKLASHWNCFFDKCHKNSYAQSLISTLEVYFHKSFGFLRRVEVFISPSKFLRDKYREFGFPSEISYLPNPVLDFQKASTLSTEEKIKFQDGILFFGRLSIEKGVNLLLEAYARLDSDFPLIIVGDGPEKDCLESIAKEKNIANKVFFAGYRDSEQLMEIISLAKVVVNPSVCYENAPYSLLEAMKLGKAVIASRLGGQKELIQDGITGFLIEPGDVDSLVDKLKKLLLDNELTIRLGIQAKESVEIKNSAEDFYVRLVEIYQGLICSKQTPSINKRI